MLLCCDESPGDLRVEIVKTQKATSRYEAVPFIMVQRWPWGAT